MKLTGIKLTISDLTLEDILNGKDDPHGLLKDLKPKKTTSKSNPLTIRLDEINQFIDKNSRRPDPNSENISEMVLGEALRSIIQKHSEDQDILKNDRHNLLTLDFIGVESATIEESDCPTSSTISKTVQDIETSKSVTSLEDIFNTANSLLEDSAGIFNLQHVPAAKQNKDMPDEIAERKQCIDFWKFEALFSEMQQKLKNGEYQLQKFSNNSQIREGDFFILKGVTCFVDSIAAISERDDTHNPRMRLIFENGVESNMLMRSLAASLYKDENGRRVLQGAEAVTESLINTSHKDKPLGYLYILRSLGNKPALAQFDNLYKIGFTTTTIQDRIKNAERDTAFLESPVEVVKYFECRQVNPHMLERLTHTFLEAQRIKVMLVGRDGQHYLPNEWFNVPLETIVEVVKRISNGTINQYRMNNTTGEMVRK